MMDGWQLEAAPSSNGSTGLADSLLDHIGEALLVVDSAFRVVQANRPAAAMADPAAFPQFPPPPEALSGLSAFTVWPALAGGPGEDACHRALGAQSPATASWRCPQAGGDAEAGRRERWLALRAVPCGAGLAIFCRDDTEQAALREKSRLAQARERQLAQAIESTTENVFVLSPEWRFTFLNAAAQRDMAPEGAALGRIVWDVFPGWRDGALAQMLRACMQQREAGEAGCVREHRAGIGPARHYIARAFPVENDGIVVFTRDVTAQHATEARLQEAQAMLRALGDSSPDLLFVKDLQSRMLYANPACLAVIGRPDEAVLGFDDRLFLSGAEAEATMHNDRLVMDRGQRIMVDERITDPHTGRVRVFQSVKAPLRGQDGSVFGLAGVCREVTELREAAALQREHEARLHELVAQLDLATILVRSFADRTIQFWSKGCERLYGWSAAEAIGRRVHDLLDVVYSEPVPAIQAALLRDGEWSGDLLHRRRDGTVLTVAVRKVLQRDGQGAPAAVMESLADVTALRQAQRDLRQLNETLEARVQTEVAARQEAQSMLAHAQRLEALGQLAGGIAHDFNNVIQAVLGGARLIETRTEDDGARRIATMIGEAANRGASVTRRLLAFARRDALQAESVPLPALLAGLLDVLRPALGPHIARALDLPEGLPPVMADRAQLETVLVNLATNARDAMRGGGTLSITAAADGRPAGLPLQAGGTGGTASSAFIRIVVADTGCGMDSATLLRAAEPFFTTKPTGEGTGLGLSMAKGFAEQSGGRMLLESRPGEGTRVSLWLPAGGDEVLSQIEDAAPPQSGSRAPRVLLVDDEKLVREMLGEQLADSGYAVHRAESADVALAMLQAGLVPDVLITDLSMPGMDGMALIRAARATAPALPAVLLTGYAGDVENPIFARLLGGSVALLRKPVSGAELASRIEALLPR